MRYRRRCRWSLRGAGTQPAPDPGRHILGRRRRGPKKWVSSAGLDFTFTSPPGSVGPLTATQWDKNGFFAGADLAYGQKRSPSVVVERLISTPSTTGPRPAPASVIISSARRTLRPRARPVRATSSRNSMARPPRPRGPWKRAARGRPFPSIRHARLLRGQRSEVRYSTQRMSCLSGPPFNVGQAGLESRFGATARVFPSHLWISEWPSTNEKPPAPL